MPLSSVWQAPGAMLHQPWAVQPLALVEIADGDARPGLAAVAELHPGLGRERQENNPGNDGKGCENVLHGTPFGGEIFR